MFEPFSITGFNNFNNKWLPSHETDIEIGYFYYKLLPFFFLFFLLDFYFLSALLSFASLHHCDNFFKQFDANYRFLYVAFLFFFPRQYFSHFQPATDGHVFQKRITINDLGEQNTEHWITLPLLLIIYNGWFITKSFILT